jgi:hypothetical protein
MTSVSGTMYGSKTLVYNDDNRLTSLTYGGVTDLYYYKYTGQRYRARLAGTYYRYLYNGDRVLEELNDSGTMQARYTTENDSYYGQWLHLYRPTGSLSRFPMYDNIGSTRGLLDASGTATDWYELDTFGRQVSSSGTTPNPYRFGAGWGYITDPSGFLQLGERFYWPEVGRFVARDPDIVHSPARLADVQNRMRSRRTGGFPGGPAVELGVHRAAIREALLRQALPGTRAETAYDYAQGRPTASFDPTGLISEQACDWICLVSCSVGGGALCSLCLNIPPPGDYRCLLWCIPTAAAFCDEWCYHICDPCDRW